MTNLQFGPWTLLLTLDIVITLFFSFCFQQALLAEGRFYSDLELTEKEIERMVIEVSRAEYLADSTFKQQLGDRESSTSNAEPSSSGASESFTLTPLYKFYFPKNSLLHPQGLSKCFRPERVKLSKTLFSVLFYFEI